MALYSALTARYVASTELLPDNVAACGGLVGDGAVPEVVAFEQTNGAMAVEKFAVIAQGCQAVTPRASPVGPATAPPQCVPGLESHLIRPCSTVPSGQCCTLSPPTSPLGDICRPLRPTLLARVVSD